MGDLLGALSGLCPGAVRCCPHARGRPNIPKGSCTRDVVHQLAPSAPPCSSPTTRAVELILLCPVCCCCPQGDLGFFKIERGVNALRMEEGDCW